MTRYLYQLLFAVSSLALAGGVVYGQTNLSAKTNFRPGTTNAEESDRTRDGLRGPVRRVRTEVTKVTLVDGKLTDNGKRVLLETAEYDLKGAKIRNQYFPVGGSSPTGRETYKYDDKGNISEMTLMGADGSLISKETYKYDYDSLGNWIKMTSSVAVVENGRISFEPTEVTQRTIFYYLDAAMTRMLEAPAGAPANSTVESSVANSSSAPATERKSALAWQPPPARNINLAASFIPSLVPESKNTRIVEAPKVSGSDNAPPPAPKAAPLPITGGVLNGQAISLPAPLYPDAARRTLTGGTVRVEVVVDENGKVVSAKAVSGPGLLRDASVQAAQRAKFSPTKLSGKPVQVTGVIVYNFTLPR